MINPYITTALLLTIGSLIYVILNLTFVYMDKNIVHTVHFITIHLAFGFIFVLVFSCTFSISYDIISDGEHIIMSYIIVTISGIILIFIMHCTYDLLLGDE